MIEFNTMILENGVEYTEVDDLIYNDTKYLLLSTNNISFRFRYCQHKSPYGNFQFTLI